MRASLIIKFVAEVSSSTRRVDAPISSASIMLAACEVLPEASGDEKQELDFPNGRLFMKADISTGNP